MSRVQVAVFPAILLGIFMILGLTSLIGNPQIVLASSNVEANLSQNTGQLKVAADPAPPDADPTGDPETFVGENTPVPYVEPVFEEKSDSEQNNTRSQPPDGCSLSDRYAASVLQWCGLIETYAAENGIEANLVAALITQESGGDPQAYSHSGAVGLMQVMPSDGLAANFMCISGPCFSDRPSTQELLDPEYNIAYGTKMLAGLINKYGNLRDALKYYGPINVGYDYADLVLGIFNSHQS